MLLKLIHPKISEVKTIKIPFSLKSWFSVVRCQFWKALTQVVRQGSRILPDGSSSFGAGSFQDGHRKRREARNQTQFYG